MAHLFSPITIAGRTLRNRIVMAPSTSGYASLDGFIGDALYEYYLARAHGGGRADCYGNRLYYPARHTQHPCPHWYS
ncbi:MAG: hypothetical protein HC893_07380 [Chloroflexaceae bacterium]|nr:hypothetical protein [Chloroflexaceae bacterium]